MLSVSLFFPDNVIDIFMMEKRDRVPNLSFATASSTFVFKPRVARVRFTSFAFESKKSHCSQDNFYAPR